MLALTRYRTPDGARFTSKPAIVAKDRLQREPSLFLSKSPSHIQLQLNSDHSLEARAILR